jgi:Carboxypeptidase regulatory-like domain
MRPLHALLLIAGLAAALLAGVFLIGSGDRSGAVAPPIETGPAGGSARSSASRDSALQSPDGVSTSESRSVKSIAPIAATNAAPKPNDDGSGFALSGRIVTATGRPVAVASVYAAAAQGMMEIALDEMDSQAMPWLHRVDTQSDADGRLSLRVQAQGSLRLAVRASGFAPHDAEIAISGNGQDVGDVVLEPGVVLTGRVVDSAGHGVAAAELRSRRDNGGGIVILGGTRGAVLAKTDDQGRFKVDQLASGAWKLTIASEDHPDKIESGETDRPGSTVLNLEFVLEDGAEIQGRVVGAPPTSLANLWVRAALRPAGPDGDAGTSSFATEITSSPFAGARRAKCGADGSFTLRGLKRSQNYRLVAREGEADLGGRSRTQTLQAKAGDRGVELKWKPETALVFQVVDAITSNPVTDFTVEAGYGWSLPLLGEDGKPVKHFNDGRVRFANLPQKPDGQTAEFSIEAVGYRRFERKGLEPVEGQDLDLGVIRLERSPVLKVTVLDATTSAPIADASVTLSVEEPKDNSHRMFVSFGDTSGDDVAGPGRAQHGKTDAQGRTSVTSLPGKQAVLRVRHPNYAAYATLPIALPLDQDFEQTVRMVVGGSVLVQVVDSKGRAVPGQSIEHKGPDGNEPPLLIGANASDETDSLGKVSFEHLEPGPHRFRLRDRPDSMTAMGGGAIVRAVRRGGPQAESGPAWSDVQVGDRTHEDVTLTAPARSNLSGRVTEGGKPLSGATVRLTDKSDNAPPALPFFGEGKDARTNGKGEYLLENVKEGEYRVSVSHGSRAMSFESSVTLREGDNALDVEMPVCTIEGRVTNSDNKPLAGVRVRAERSTGDDGKPKMQVAQVLMVADNNDEPQMSFSTGTGGGETVVTDADGKYRLRGVLADVDLVVKATGKDVQPGQSAVVRVSADQTKSGVDLTLFQGGSIEVTVLHADGRAGSSCIVHGRIDGDSVDPKTELSGPSGVVKLTGLKPGKWHLNVNPIGPASGTSSDRPAEIPEQIVEVKAGEASPARFDIP